MYILPLYIFATSYVQYIYIYVCVRVRTSKSQITLHDNSQVEPAQPTCKYDQVQPDLHLQTTQIYLRLVWSSQHLNTENGCISQHSEHHNNLPGSADRQHISARHDHYLLGCPPGPHRHQWSGKLVCLQRVFIFMFHSGNIWGWWWQTSARTNILNSIMSTGELPERN